MSPNQPNPSPTSPGNDKSASNASQGLSLTQNQLPASHFLNLGNRHYNSYLSRAHARDLDTAIGHYRQALELDPNLPEGYVKLASALWDKGEINLSTASHYCQVALKLNPNNPEAHLFLGYFLKKDGRLDEALAQFETAIAQAPLHSAKSRIALGSGLIQKASVNTHLPQSQRLFLTVRGLLEFIAGCMLLPTDTTTYQALKAAVLQDMAIYGLLWSGRLLNGLGLKGLTCDLYTWATRQLPSEGLFFHLLGDLHHSRNNLSAAILHYGRALEIEPENLDLHKKLGKAYNDCNDTLNAARSLEKVLELDEDDFDVLYQLAQIHTERQEFMRALYYFKEAVVRCPGNPYVHSNMAYVLFKLDDFDGAIEEYHQAIGFGEDPVWTATVAQTLGTLYYQVREDIPAAIGLFETAHRMDPENLDCMAMLGDLYFKEDNLEAALEAYWYILSHEPENADCYCYIGYILWQMDRTEEAIDAYMAALTHDPQHAVANNNLGVIYLDERADAAKALELFEKALALQSDYTLAAFNRGRAQECLGQITEAAKSYSDALSLNGENPELEDQEILTRLNHLFHTD